MAFRAKWAKRTSALRDGRLLRTDKLTHDGQKVCLTSPEYEDADITINISRVKK
jgi:hypothetical protein